MLNQQMYSHLSSKKPLAVVASSTCYEGYELAKQFAESGYDLIVAAANASVVEETEDFKELGIDAVSFQLDLSTTEGVEQLYRKIIATGRSVEAMVINTGISSNSNKEIELARKILKDMIDRGHGRILFEGHEAQAVCKSLQTEAIGTGVSLAVIQPGSNEIYFLKKGFEDPVALN